MTQAHSDKPVEQAKTVVIAGGAGDVGEEITRRFLRAGFNVVVPSRSKPKLDQLIRALGDVNTNNLLPVVADINTEEGSAALVEQSLARFNAVDGVVAALGNWYMGGTLDQFSLAEWSQIVQGGITSHFAIARSFIPLLRDRKDSFYIFVNGGAALAPIPNSGPVSVVAAAQEMIKNVLAEENRDTQLRVNSLMIKAMVKTRASLDNPYASLAAKDVASFVLWLASHEAGHLAGQTVPFGHASELPASTIISS
jgi:NAD(P)-dependent dehydrogenase (short-subunit alcohol dehydrogenase family)